MATNPKQESTMLDKGDAGSHVEAAEYEGKVPEASSNEHIPVKDWTPEEEKALKKSIDWRLLPMLCVVMGLSLLDRVNISAAYVAGMGEDLNMNIGTRYSICLLLFFVTYGLFEIPSNLIIRRIGARYWLSSLIIAWGCCVMGMGFIHSWKVMAVLRIMLGVFEAGLLPGSIFLISSWYTKYEMARRITIFYMSALVTNAFGGIFAYALEKVSVGSGIYSQGWRWIFIVEGLATLVAGFLAFFTLGEFPESARWLSDRQRHIAMKRVALESGNQDYKHVSLKEALGFLVDVKVVVFCLMYYVSASSVYSVAYFTPVILSAGMGFDRSATLLLTSPPWVFCIIMSITMAFVSDRYRTRWPIHVFQALNTIVGLLIVLYAPPAGVRLLGLFLATYGAQSNVISNLSYAENNTGHPSKKGVVTAAMITCGAAGGITGSTIFRSQDAPRYIPGMWATIAFQFLYLFMIACTTLWFKRQNRRVKDGKIATIEGLPGFLYAP